MAATAPPHRKFSGNFTTTYLLQKIDNASHLCFGSVEREPFAHPAADSFHVSESRVILGRLLLAGKVVHPCFRADLQLHIRVCPYLQVAAGVVTELVLVAGNHKLKAFACVRDLHAAGTAAGRFPDQHSAGFPHKEGEIIAAGEGTLAGQRRVVEVIVHFRVLFIEYTVQNGNENTVVDCFAGGNYTAKIADGKVVVNVPDPVTDGQVLVWAQNDAGLFSMVKLNFTVKAEVVILTSEADYQAIPAEAGRFDIDLTSNVDVEVKIPAEATWVKAVLTKSAYVLTLTLEENTTGAPREAVIDIVRKDNGAVVQQVKIIQIAGKEKVLTLERVWGFYKEGDTPWYATSNITGVSIANPDGYGMARGLAMDDEYIYLPKASGYANVAAVSIKDKTVQKALNKTGINGGSIFATSFVRMIKNTDPSVNGGKDVLLLCNLTATETDAAQLRLYAYKDGVDAAPTQIAGYLLPVI